MLFPVTLVEFLHVSARLLIFPVEFCNKTTHCSVCCPPSRENDTWLNIKFNIENVPELFANSCSCNTMCDLCILRGTISRTLFNLLQSVEMGYIFVFSSFPFCNAATGSSPQNFGFWNHQLAGAIVCKGWRKIQN